MLIVQGRRVVLPDGIRPASLHIDNGRIEGILSYDQFPDGVEIFDAGDSTISPGLVDSHVHINEPGRTEWEGFDTATRAAAAGGVTTLVDMPLNSVPATTTVGALEEKRHAARGRVHVDVGFWGGVVPGNANDLAPLAAAGVLGFKCFLTPSGVPEFERVCEADLRDAMPHIARLQPRPLPLLVHAEDPSLLCEPDGDRRRYSTYLATRPAAAEVSAIRLIGELSREYGIPAHIVHVSSDEGLSAIVSARGAGALLTAETCPHYLSFVSDEIPAGATAFKCAPPIREGRHRDALWGGLRENVLQLVASDHSPSPPAMKQQESGDFCAAWGGIASLQVSLPVVWTEARQRGFTECHLAEWMSRRPAMLSGLSHRKGALAVGLDADFIVWDPAGEQVIQGAHLWHRHPMTPYEGRTVSGLVSATYLRGRCVWRAGRFEHEFGGSLL